MSEMQSIWGEQSLLAPDVEKIAVIVETIGAEDRRFRSQIWWRDFREIATALAVAIFFPLVGRTWLSWIPSLCALFTAAYLLRSRMPKLEVLEPLTLAGRLQRMSEDVQVQIRLLRSVLWWYLSPAAVGIAALYAEVALFSTRPRALLLPSLICLLALVAVYFLNRWYAATRLEPRRQELKKLLSELQPADS